jgi:5-methylcytosine-specific restriction endonuclease McrA
MQQVLVLNASFEPLRPMPMRRALRLVLQQKAEIVEADECEIRSMSASMARPVVIRLKKFVRVPPRFRRSVSNTFLFARDQYRCQYCGRHERELGKREFLNRDHVIPQSQGGANTWENCVTACSSCNAKKDDKTLRAAGMKLLSVPVEPTLVHLRWHVRSLTAIQQKYITMFYGEAWLKQIPRHVRLEGKEPA